MNRRVYFSVLGIAVLAAVSYPVYHNTNSESRTVHRTPTQSETGSAVQAAVEVQNECFEKKSKPFSKYQKFYYKSDGKPYGLKSGQEVSIKIEESKKKLNGDGSVNYVATLNEFKITNKISPEL